jgi:hypothetical protein
MEDHTTEETTGTTTTATLLPQLRQGKSVTSKKSRLVSHIVDVADAVEAIPDILHPHLHQRNPPVRSET